MDKTANKQVVNDIKGVSEDSTLTGPNTELLSVRVSKGLYRELELLAKKSKRQLPEVVREMLWFHAFPSNLQARLKELKAGNARQPDELAMAHYFSLSPQLAMYQHQVDKVLQSCEVVKDIEKQALKLKAKLEKLEAEAKVSLQEFLDATNT